MSAAFRFIKVADFPLMAFQTYAGVPFELRIEAYGNITDARIKMGSRASPITHMADSGDVCPRKRRKETRPKIQTTRTANS